MEGIRNTLTRKIGPLPVYAWGLMVIAVIAIFIVWRRSRTSSSGSVVAGGGGSSPTDFSVLGSDPSLVPVQPVTTPSVAPGTPGSAAPVAPALTGSGPSFAPIQSSPSRLTPVMTAAKPHAIPSGPLAGVVPQGPSPAAHPKNAPQPSGISQMWTGARVVASQAAALQKTQLSPLGAQANPHGRERT